MTHWAILSGINGNLSAYETVLADLKRVRYQVEALYILGDLVGPDPQCEALVQRVRQPRRGELEPQVCLGWWEEQCFNLHGMGSDPEATELLKQAGPDGVEQLWKSVSRQTVQWLKSLDFGFFEFDCLLIHGSTVGCHDLLIPETPPMQLLDRLLRAEANTLFCGRSGQTFQLQIPAGAVTSTVTTLDDPAQTMTQTVRDRQIVGVGSVGKNAGKATYTLYSPYTNAVSFRTVRYGTQSKGFGSV
ncbi:MAG: metallophosphatase [Leptolyngbya sp. SIOISBB]|nr:metallophosphatase [Leptolyngbya sp. SIOISBB]